MTTPAARPSAIVLFDGDCAFCDRSVRWIMRRDRDAHLRFLPLAGPEGRDLLLKHHVPQDLDSLVLIDANGAAWKSEGLRRILRHLPRWRALAPALGLLPLSWRDRAYDLFARNRHRILSNERCELPPTP